jgi:hypothetical protein
MNMRAADVLVEYRSADGKRNEATLDRVDPEEVIAGSPVRDFVRYRGQRHYSGWYWSSTTGRLLAYESRLELARIQLADFDPEVGGIAGQPFRLSGPDGGAAREHVPDLLLASADGGFTVVDVKDPGRLGKPEVRAQFAWTEQVCALRGWGFEAWSGEGAALLANIRMLAGYRREETIFTAAVADVLAAARQPASIGSIEATLAADHPLVLIRPVILHLLWTGALTADLSRPLSVQAIVRPAMAGAR